MAIALSLQAQGATAGLNGVAKSLGAVEASARKAEPAMAKVTAGAEKQASAMSKLTSALGTFTLAAFGIDMVARSFEGFFADAVNSQDVATQLNSVLTSTKGISGETAKSVTDLSTALSLVTRFDDEAITSAQSMLLTFTQIGRGVMPQATTSVLNMSTALHEDLQEAAIQVGKALQDPVAGVTALQRVGVRLTESQKELVTSLVATGDVMGAQRVILAELDTEFGGAAVAAGTTFAGQLAILNTQIGNLKEDIGGPLLGVMASLVRVINTDVVPSIRASGSAIERDADIISQAYAKIRAAQDGASIATAKQKTAAEAMTDATDRWAGRSMVAVLVNDTWLGSLIRVHQGIGELGTAIDFTEPKVQHLSDTMAAVRDNGTAGGSMFVAVRPQVQHLGDTMAEVAGDAAELANKLIADKIALVAFNDQVALMRKQATDEMARDPNAGRPLFSTDPESTRREAAASQGLLQTNLAATEAAALKAGKALGSVGTNALAALPGLSALDMAIAGTSQQLAGVQLKIEQKVFDRMKGRPINNDYQREAFLQEQLKVEQLQKAAGFTVGTEAIKIANATRPKKGAASTTKGDMLPGDDSGGGVTVNVANVQITASDADAAGAQFAAFLKSLLAGGGAGAASTSLAGIKN